MTFGGSRRSFLLGSAAFVAARGAIANRAIPKGLSLSVMSFEDAHPFVRRASILVPSELAAGEKVPVLFLLHGLGEAKQGADVGTFAWIDRYGLATSDARLRTPPLASVEERHDLTKARAKELDDELSQKPYRGFVLVCPFTPNVWSYRNTESALDDFADFLVGPLIDRISKEIDVADTMTVGLDGCSLGGYMALEIFTRKPSRFRTLGVLQPAITAHSVTRYVETIDAAHTRDPKLRVHVESSAHDPYLDVSKRLAHSLDNHGVPNEFRAPPGSHDQPFLRDVGTLEMLLWHDRMLRP